MAQWRETNRGFKRRQTTQTTMIGIDETSIQKKHPYAMVILDKDTDTVTDILENRKHLRNGLKHKIHVILQCFLALRWICVILFIKVVQSTFDNAEEMISFDGYHVSQYFCKAVDNVCSQENKRSCINVIGLC